MDQKLNSGRLSPSEISLFLDTNINAMDKSQSESDPNSRPCSSNNSFQSSNIFSITLSASSLVANANKECELQTDRTLVSSSLRERQRSFTLEKPSRTDLPIINSESNFPLAIDSDVFDLESQIQRLKLVKSTLIKYHKLQLDELEQNHHRDLKTLDDQISYLANASSRISILGSVKSPTLMNGHVEENALDDTFTKSFQNSPPESHKFVNNKTPVTVSKNLNDEPENDLFSDPIASVIMDIVKRESVKSAKAKSVDECSSTSTIKQSENPKNFTLQPQKSPKMPSTFSNENLAVFVGPAGSKLSALIQGHLTRRFLKVDRVKRLVQTIKDMREQLNQLRNEDELNNTDLQFATSLESQLLSKLNQFHSLLFRKSANEQIKIIAQDRLTASRRKMKENRARSSANLSSAKLFTVNSKPASSSPSTNTFILRRSVRPLWKKPISSTFVIKRNATPPTCVAAKTTGVAPAIRRSPRLNNVNAQKCTATPRRSSNSLAPKSNAPKVSANLKDRRNVKKTETKPWK